MTVNVHEAKTHLSRLLRKVQEGNEVVIARDGRPVAKLIPVGQTSGPRTPGSARGRVRIGRDFDKPLPGWRQLTG